MKHITATIEGTTPLLCNRFTDDRQKTASKYSCLAFIGERESPMDLAKKRLYIGSDKNPVIPQSNLFRCMAEGSVLLNGEPKMPFPPGAVEVDGLEIPICHKAPWAVDTRSVRNPRTGRRMLCHRPRFNDWSLSFTINFDPDMITAAIVRDILNVAGRRVGLGDFRPACMGVFGKFAVTTWVLRA